MGPANPSARTRACRGAPGAIYGLCRELTAEEYRPKFTKTFYFAISNDLILIVTPL